MCFEKGCNLAIAIGTILGAIGTISVVIYALYKDFWNKPKLECKLEEENDHIYETKTVSGEIMKYCRLEIHNKGRTSLKNVEVMITDLQKIDGDKYEKVKYFSPDNLIWSFSGEIYCPYISPETFQLCNLGNIINEKIKIIEIAQKYIYGDNFLRSHQNTFDTHDNLIYLISSSKYEHFAHDPYKDIIKDIRQYQGKLFELNVRFKSLNLHSLLAIGQYQAEITVGAENAGAIKKIFKMTISETDPKFLIEDISLTHSHTNPLSHS